MSDKKQGPRPAARSGRGDRHTFMSDKKQSDKEQLRQRFNKTFARWEIELPMDALELGEVRLIVQRGWTIWTRFNAEDGREYLDYYAMHRMTNDRHERLFLDGDRMGLPAMLEGSAYGQDASEEERDEAKAQYYAHNQDVAKLREEKGFHMTEDAHFSAKVRCHRHAHSEANAF